VAYDDAPASAERLERMRAERLAKQGASAEEKRVAARRGFSSTA
jgi:hypothetical protein